MVTNQKMMSKILSLGCSYSLKVGKNVGTPAASIDYLLEQVKYYKSYNINLDIARIPLKDLLWIMDITQVGRLSKKIPIEFAIDNQTRMIHHSQEKLGTDYFSFFTENFDEEKSFTKEYIKWWNKENKLHCLKSIEDHIKDYLITIKKIQDELIGYDYKMYLMNNTFEGYFYKDNILQHKYSNHNEYKIPDLKNTIKLKDLYPKLWKDIDLSKFRFYSVDGNQYGGLDEYTIDNFGKDQFMDYEWKDKVSPFGMHPKNEAQRSFLNEIILNKL